MAINKNELVVLAQRLREYVGNPHHIDPMSDSFKLLIKQASGALSDCALSEDFDRVTAERDAALLGLSEIKESLAYRGSLLCRIEGQRDALQQRLTAADEREYKWKELLRNLDEAWNSHDGRELFGRLMRKVEEELKPSDELAAQHAALDFFDAAPKPAEVRRNQCDGCQVGIPVVDGAHRMGKPGGYPDTMSCTAKLYKPAEGAHDFSMIGIEKMPPMEFDEP